MFQWEQDGTSVYKFKMFFSISTVDYQRIPYRDLVFFLPSSDSGKQATKMGMWAFPNIWEFQATTITMNVDFKLSTNKHMD